MIKQLAGRPTVPARIKRMLKKLRPLSGGEWELKTNKAKINRAQIEAFKSIIRPQLKKIQNNNCAYCGLKVGETSRFEIEHVAPKGGPARPNHIEHTFTAINLVIACNLCNCAEKKGIYDTVVRGTKNLDYRKIQFRIVHPYLDDHSLHYSWGIGDEGVLIQGVSPKGIESIRLFDLDSSVHSEARVKMKMLEFSKSHPEGAKLLEQVMAYNP